MMTGGGPRSEDIDSATGAKSPVPALAEEQTADLGAWWLAVLLATYYAIAVIDRVSLSHVAEYIRLDLSITDFQMSLILGPAFAIPLGLFAYVFGWAVDRYQRRLILFIAVSGWSLMTMAGALAGSFGALALCRIGVAAFEAAMVPAAASLLADRFPARRLASGIAVYTMGPKVGASLAFIVAGAAIALGHSISGSSIPFLGERTTWQIVLFAVGAPGLPLALLCWTIKEPKRRTLAEAKAAAVGASSFRDFLVEQRRLIIPLVLGFGCVGAAIAAIDAWVPVFMNRAYGWTAIEYGPWLGTLSALGSMSVLLKGAAVDWLYARGLHDAAVRFYTWLLMFGAPLGVIAFLAPSPYIFFAAYFFSYSVALPPLLYALTFIPLFTPAPYRGRLTGLLMMILPMIAFGIGPTATAALTDFVFQDPTKIGWSLAIVVGVGVSAGLMLLRIALGAARQLTRVAEPSSASCAGAA